MNHPSSSTVLFEPWSKSIKLYAGNRLTICHKASHDLGIQNGDNLAIFSSLSAEKEPLLILIKTQDIIGKNLLPRSHGAASVHEWKHNDKKYYSIIFPKRLLPNGGLSLNDPLFFCVTNSPDPEIKKITLFKKSTETVDKKTLTRLQETLP